MATAELVASGSRAMDEEMRATLLQVTPRPETQIKCCGRFFCARRRVDLEFPARSRLSPWLSRTLILNPRSFCRLQIEALQIAPAAPAAGAAG